MEDEKTGDKDYWHQKPRQLLADLGISLEQRPLGLKNLKRLRR